MNKAANAAIRQGQFIIGPLKRLYNARKQATLKLLYNAWQLENEERCFADSFKRQGPLVSIIVPAYNPGPADFSAMVYSVVNQHYEAWELIIVNASSEESSRKQVAEAAFIDTRIRVIDHKNDGISNNTNIGIGAAKGEYVAFLDHDDLLHPCALHTCMEAMISKHADLVYTDEDKVSADGSLYFDPFCKPDWSPDLFENVNYINHLTIMRADHVHAVGGLRPACDGAQDYDLLFRVIDTCKPKTVHVPLVLYHWRAAATSTASDISTKTYVLKAGTAAVQEHLDRAKIEGTAKAIVNRPGFYEIDFALPPTITILLGPVEPVNHRRCIAWIRKLMPYVANYKDVQLVAGEWMRDFDFHPEGVSIAYLPADDYWSAAAKAVTNDVVVCFTAAALPHGHKAVDGLAGRAYQRRAMVAPLLVSEGSAILDAGLVMTPYGKEALFRGQILGESTYFGTTEWVRNVDGLTLSVFAARRTIMREFLDSLRSGEMPNDYDLTAFLARQAKPVDLVVDAQSPHVFTGYLASPRLPFGSHFNPQLVQTYRPMIMMNMSAWGAIGESSERDDK